MDFFIQLLSLVSSFNIDRFINLCYIITKFFNATHNQP